MIRAKNFAVLIPSRGRWNELAKTFIKQPFLNASNVYIGIENREKVNYEAAMDSGALWHKTNVILFDNPDNFIGVAREHVRKAAVKRGYDDYVITDDNTHYTEQSLHNLVLARREYPQQPCIMAGSHGTAAHFHKKVIEKEATKVGRFTSYPKMSSMFWCFPNEIMATYRHPMYCSFDDHHLAFWLIEQGITNFRICLDAPFGKSRHRAGGNGSLARRTWIIGKRIQQLTEDFPTWMSPEVIGYRINWSKLEDVIVRNRESWQLSNEKLVLRRKRRSERRLKIRLRPRSSN
jgi:hypothetical protein